jgi:hypothetical protein
VAIARAFTGRLEASGSAGGATAAATAKPRRHDLKEPTMPPDLFEPRRWERNGTSFELRHVPGRKSVALLYRLTAQEVEVLGWLSDADAHLYAAILDRMLPPPTYGDNTYGGDTP